MKDHSGVGGCTEKGSSVISDENPIDTLNISEAVVKPATSTMSLLPGMTASPMLSLKSESKGLE